MSTNQSFNDNVNANANGNATPMETANKLNVKAKARQNLPKQIIAKI